jgi:hypothetical protein
VTDIRSFSPGAQEQRGAVRVGRYADSFADVPALTCDHDEFWHLSFTDAVGRETLIRLSSAAVNGYREDETILSVAATELLRMAIAADPDAKLPDGRALAGLKPQELYRAAADD